MNEMPKVGEMMFYDGEWRKVYQIQPTAQAFWLEGLGNTFYTSSIGICVFPVGFQFPPVPKVKREEVRYLYSDQLFTVLGMYPKERLRDSAIPVTITWEE